MGLSRSLGMYSDVKTVFDAVISRGPGSLRFASKSAATAWRMRAYFYRKLLHELQLTASERMVGHTFTPYDAIRISQDKEDGRILHLKQAVIVAEFTLAETGEVLDLNSAPQPQDHDDNSILEDDPLFLAARALKGD